MIQTIILAMAGGFLVNVRQLVEYYKLPKTQRPDFKDPLFYVSYFVWPIAAGVLAYAYYASNIQLSPLLALNVGLSAPLIIKAMTEFSPFNPNQIDPGDGA